MSNFMERTSYPVRFLMAAIVLVVIGGGVAAADVRGQSSGTTTATPRSVPTTGQAVTTTSPAVTTTTAIPATTVTPRTTTSEASACDRQATGPDDNTGSPLVSDARCALFGTASEDKVARVVSGRFGQAIHVTLFEGEAQDWSATGFSLATGGAWAREWCHYLGGTVVEVPSDASDHALCGIPSGVDWHPQTVVIAWRARHSAYDLSPCLAALKADPMPIPPNGELCL